MKAAVSKLLSGDGLKTLKDLVKAAQTQQLTVTGKAIEKPTAEQRAMVNEAKANKLKLASLVKKLPPEIRSAIEQDKGIITELKRGVHNRNINETPTWKNGKFVYGFTPDIEIAERFYTKGGAVVRSRDIESFGGIIDTRLLENVVREYNEQLWGKRSGWDKNSNMPTPAGIAENKELYKRWNANRIPYVNTFGEEREMLVYDIKFKKTGDQYYTDESAKHKKGSL